MLRKLMKVGCAVFLSILAACHGAQTTKTGPVITSTPFVTSSPAATVDPKNALQESIIQVLGTDDKSLPRLTKISYSDPEAGDITITWAINDDGLQTAKVNAQIDAVNILKALEINKARFIYVILNGTLSRQDGHGNTTQIQAMSLGFNKSKLDRIHWESFQPSDIFDLADIAVVMVEWK